VPYVKYNETSSLDAVLPTVATAVGIGFKYGFVDLAVNYLPLKWKGEFAYEGEKFQGSFEHYTRLVGNLRIGLGFPF
jgi:hypothetical protein